MAKDCSVCISPNRAEIEARLKRKEPVRSVSRWLLEEKQETISKSSLLRHAQDHLALPSEFASKAFSLPRLVPPVPVEPTSEELPAVATTLAPLDALANIQDKAMKILDDLAPKMTSEGLTPPLVSLFNGVMKEARQAAKHRHELVNGKKYVGQINIQTNATLKEAPTDELKKKRDELRLKMGGTNG